MNSLRHLLIGLAAASGTAHAAGKTTTVTTYVTTVQDEREQTRWTLTKWLEIKERMKMMDVWLAMFSDPKRDQFAPELMLSYGMTKGSLTHRSAGAASETSALQGKTGRAQIWLTNVVSSAIGVRMLNIDLGVEAYQRETGIFADPAAAIDPEGTGTPRKLRTSNYTGNLRLFGKNVQDSSLVLKYGRFDTENTIADVKRNGESMGAEMQLYLFKWLGVEGNYLRYGKDDGSYYDYQGYVEISLLRFSAGPYREDWSTKTNEIEEAKTTEKGYVGNLKLSF